MIKISYHIDPKFLDTFDCSGRTMHTQIRLLLEEQSDQGLHHLHLLMAHAHCNTHLFKF